LSSIIPLGFIETSGFTALLLVGKEQKAAMVDGVLKLRDLGEDDEVVDLAITKGWKGARGLLARLRTAAAAYFNDVTPELGRAWVEMLPPGVGTPWDAETGDYADRHLRTRTCLVPCPGAVSYSGNSFSTLNVGIVNLIDHRQLCSEVNHGEHARWHLVVDVRVPDAPAES
jgi:hypothetical protein